jgi:hypothetical protein
MQLLDQQDSSFPGMFSVQLFCLKGPPVATIVISMIIILGLAGGTVGLVLVGMQGRGRVRAPKLAHTMARAAQHLNGDAQPPEGLVRFIEGHVVRAGHGNRG